MQQKKSQEEVRRIIISDMVKKRNTIVPVIGEDTIVYSLGVPFVLLWLLYGALKWFHSALEKGSKVMRRYKLLTNIGSSPHEASLLSPRTYVHEAMNIGCIIKSNKNTLYFNLATII